jgi:hypothetical protein
VSNSVFIGVRTLSLPALQLLCKVRCIILYLKGKGDINTLLGTSKNIMENLFELSTISVACIPIVIGLVGICNTFISKKYSSILAILFGIGFVALTGVAWQFYLAQGIIVGLSACGLYSAGKKLIE